MNYQTKQIKGVRFVDKSILSSPYSLEIIFSDSIETIAKLEQKYHKLKDYYKCENACATSDCYKLKEILYSLEAPEKFDKNINYKVINTGTIGRYFSRWGKQPMKYLKDKYQYPVVNRNDFHSLFPNSYGKKANKKKIIIKGLTLLDCCIDFDGIIIPGKSTMMIECNNVEDILYLAAIINSKLMIYFIKQKYSSSSYNGGINFSKDMINSLPWATNEKAHSQIVTLVKQILSLDSDNDISKIKYLDEEINHIVYEIYDLTEEEIKTIKEFSNN